MPKTSVITIFLNAGPYLDEAVRSVIGQTHDDWELLLVDDGSTDESTAIAKKFANDDPQRIRYLEHPGHVNQGMSASRNLGLKNAKGEYIAFLDADDVWLSEKLTRQAKILEENPAAAMVYGPTLYWYGWTGQAPDALRDRMGLLGVEPNQLIYPNRLLTLYLQNGDYLPSMCGLMVRKKALLEVGGFEQEFKGLYEDQVFLAKIVLNFPVFVESGSWDKYRQHPDSACHQSLTAKIPSGLELNYFKWLKKYLSEKKINDLEIDKALRSRLAPLEPPSFPTLIKKKILWLSHFIFKQKCVPWFMIEKQRKGEVLKKG